MIAMTLSRSAAMRQAITALTLAAVLAGVLVTTAVASASTVSLPVVSWQDNGWSGMRATPPAFYFGNGASPYISGVRWKDWKSASAYGEGRLHIARVLCEPTAAPGCTVYSTRWAGVRLTDVRTHAGKRYFAEMAVKFFSKGRELTRRLDVKGNGSWSSAPRWPGL